MYMQMVNFSLQNPAFNTLKWKDYVKKYNDFIDH